MWGEGPGQPHCPIPKGTVPCSVPSFGDLSVPTPFDPE